MSRLLRAQQIARAANLQVFQRDLETGAEIVGLHDRGQAALRDLGQRAVRLGHQVGEGAHAGASDAAAELVHLGQAETFGAVEDDRVDTRDIDARFDDCRADEHVSLALGELFHVLAQDVGRHLTVGDEEARLRHEAAQFDGLAVDRAHLVVEEVDLTAAIQLTQDRLADHAVVALHHVGADRQALLGRRGDGRHVADAGDRLVQ